MRSPTDRSQAWRARVAAYAVTVGMGALLGVMPGFQIVGMLTGGRFGARGAVAAIVGGVLAAMMLLRPWGEFGRGQS